MSRRLDQRGNIMLPIDAAGAVPQQAVRPGALVWGGTRAAPDGAYSSCEQVEQFVAAAGQDDGRIDDLPGELTRARFWVPLPAGRPVTDGSAAALPTVTYLGPGSRGGHRRHRAGRGLRPAAARVPVRCHLSRRVRTGPDRRLGPEIPALSTPAAKRRNVALFDHEISGRICTQR